MTLLSRAMSMFPLFHALASGGCFLLALRELHHPTQFAILATMGIVFLYLMPPLIFRLHNALYPLKKGVVSLSEKRYSSWWGGHQIQLLFIAFPALETLLRLIPGAYSAWLRLWGSRIGKRVYWTPSVQLVDRSLMEVGDDVTFGHEVDLCAHVVTRKKDNVRLLVSGITIGSGCLIGARTRLGPGVVVHSNVDLPYNTEGWINQEFTQEPKERAYE